MAQEQNITLNQANDENINVSITTNNPADGTVLNLTGMTLESFLKASKSTSDTDPSTWKGTSVGGEVTVTDAVNGKVTVSIPGSAVVPTQQWWRLDVISATSKRKTAVYGTVAVNQM